MPRLSGTRRRADFILLGSVTARSGHSASRQIRHQITLCPLTEIKYRVRVKREMLCKGM